MDCGGCKDFNAADNGALNRGNQTSNRWFYQLKNKRRLQKTYRLQVHDSVVAFDALGCGEDSVVGDVIRHVLFGTGNTAFLVGTISAVWPPVANFVFRHTETVVSASVLVVITVFALSEDDTKIVKSFY